MGAVHDANRAWLRAGVYFTSCGVLGAVAMRGTDAFEGAGRVSGRMPATVACLVVAVVAYGLVWPRGTLTHGRRLHLGWAAGFGAVWGVAEGVGMVAVWALARRAGLAAWSASVVTFGVASAWLAAWHAQYWDVRVAPEHNIAAWNGRKVAFCHVPHLGATLTHLAVYRIPAVFVAFQIVALVLSSVAMRFPPPDIARRRV